MRPPRTVEELMAILGRRQTNVPTRLPAPVPAPILLIQPGVTTRSIPGFGVSPTQPARAPAPAPQQSSQQTSVASSTSASAQSTASTTAASSTSTSARSTTSTTAASSTSARAVSSAVNSAISSSVGLPSQTEAPTSASRGRGRTSATPTPSASVLPEAGNLIPGLPSDSSTGTMASDMMKPTESAEAPDRGSANADSPDARGQQIGVLVGILVAVGLVAGIIAMFCVRQANRKKAKQAAERAPTPDFISRPLARTDSNPWQGPIRSGSGGVGATSGGNVAAASAGAAAAGRDDEWPMGARSANRNSMENTRYDEKQQYAAQRPPPPVGAAGSTSRAQDGQAGFAGGAGMGGSYAGGGNEQYTQYPISPAPVGMTQTQADRESLSKYQAIAKINQHYAAAERMSRQPGNFEPANPPSPLYFRPTPNAPRPDSTTFGGGGGRYGGAPQQGRY
ncbi:hypothetical protein GGTG_03546 [Gaeumannomyces tritici R3-111a-1]|uniref:Uncharacterized protein n=1 Tax=Gaeumannomyces tritici (strain R3-111a-1) TaxID=644352 RepID=J3NQJ0_GAET3|nr:hypothetical protein GGTG_03546 [Gaeumannomyces tritici R3-111a-1]EJT78446.1 hypothetical protein GGTG_03546 [Gaeumannomyces tritici R3-111a-1]